MGVITVLLYQRKYFLFDGTFPKRWDVNTLPGPAVLFSDFSLLQKHSERDELCKPFLLES